MEKEAFLVSGNSYGPKKNTSSRGSISCEEENPNILTYLRNRCNSLWSLGLIVASNKGTKMFSNILPKLGRIFLDLNMSLKGEKIDTFFKKLVLSFTFVFSVICVHSRAPVPPGFRNSKFTSGQIVSVLCFLHCQALSFIQALLKLSSAPKIETACRGRCCLRAVTLSFINIHVLPGEIMSYLSWRIPFPKAVTTPNESRMLCSSEPFRKKG